MMFGCLACLIAAIFIGAGAAELGRRNTPSAVLSFGIGLIFSIFGISWIHNP